MGEEEGVGESLPRVEVEEGETEADEVALAEALKEGCAVDVGAAEAVAREEAQWVMSPVPVPPSPLPLRVRCCTALPLGSSGEALGEAVAVSKEEALAVALPLTVRSATVAVRREEGVAGAERLAQALGVPVRESVGEAVKQAVLLAEVVTVLLGSARVEEELSALGEEETLVQGVDEELEVAEAQVEGRGDGVAVAEGEADEEALETALLQVAGADGVTKDEGVSSADKVGEAALLAVDVALLHTLTVLPPLLNPEPVSLEVAVRQGEGVPVAVPSSRPLMVPVCEAGALGIPVRDALPHTVPVTEEKVDFDGDALMLLLSVGKAVSLLDPEVFEDALGMPVTLLEELGVGSLEEGGVGDGEGLKEGEEVALTDATSENEGRAVGVGPWAVALPPKAPLREGEVESEGVGMELREATREGVEEEQGALEALPAPPGLPVPGPIEAEGERVVAEDADQAGGDWLGVGEEDAKAEAVPLCASPVPLAHAVPGVPTPLAVALGVSPRGLADALPCEGSVEGVGALPVAVGVELQGPDTVPWTRLLVSVILAEGQEEAVEDSAAPVLETCGEAVPVGAASVPLPLAEAAADAVPPPHAASLELLLELGLTALEEVALAAADALAAVLLEELALPVKDALEDAVGAEVGVAALWGEPVTASGGEEAEALPENEAAGALPEAAMCVLDASPKDTVGAEEKEGWAEPDAARLTLPPAAGVMEPRRERVWTAVSVPN